MTTNIQELTIEGQVYVPKDSQKTPATGDIRIVVLQRGWVVIGKYCEQDNEVSLFPSAVIRVWGTTKGLPELVNGPTSQTKLDKSDGEIRFNIGSEILSIIVDASRWQKHIG